MDADARGHLRAGDAERESTLDRLRDAHAEGRLDVREFYARLDAVYEAKTFAELDSIVRDLPATGLVRYPAAPTRRPATRPPEPSAPTPLTSAGALAAMPAALRGAWLTWATAVSINVVVWALVSILGTEWIYPWPLWVAGPWGIVNAGMTTTWWLNRKPPDSASRPPEPDS